MALKEVSSVLTVSNKGWVVIPAGMRKKYNLLPGTEVVIVDYGSVLAILPVSKDPIKAGRGFLKGKPSMYADMKRERELEKKRDKRLANA